MSLRSHPPKTERDDSTEELVMENKSTARTQLIPPWREAMKFGNGGSLPGTGQQGKYPRWVLFGWGARDERGWG
eukprot:762618-Hanusia_phi.AAC.1